MFVFWVSQMKQSTPFRLPSNMDVLFNAPVSILPPRSGPGLSYME